MFHNLATLEENPTLLHANNKGPDQPAHSLSLISASVVGSLESKVSELYICKISVLNLVFVAEQAGLKLSTWFQTRKTGFLVMRPKYYKFLC